MRLVVLLTLLVVSTGCGSGKLGGSDAGPRQLMDTCDGGTPEPTACGGDAGSLADCVLGVWMAEAPAEACSAPGGCRADAGQPECGQQDCIVGGYSLFMASGSMLQGSFVQSIALGTFSSLLAPIDETYQIDGMMLLIGRSAATEEPYQATCSASELDVAEYSLAGRASPGLSAAIEGYRIRPSTT
jgi:hypothetical protein